MLCKGGHFVSLFRQHYNCPVNYRQAIEIGNRLNAFPDSFLFRPYIYLGGILYTQNKFDSAFYYYKKAESIGNSYPVRLTESERLFNTLGALYFETANYRQAKNYLKKAISLLPKDDPFYDALLSNYKINLAATLTKLEEYKEAKDIYLGLPAPVVNSNDVKHNLGFISLKTGDIKEALAYFRQVGYSNKNIVRLYNDISQVYFHYINLIHPDFILNVHLKRIQSGQQSKEYTAWINLQILRRPVGRKRLVERIPSQYQQAIMQFDNNFTDSAVDKDPKLSMASFFISIFFMRSLQREKRLKRCITKRKNRIPGSSFARLPVCFCFV